MKSWIYYDRIANKYDTQYDNYYWMLFNEITKKLVEKYIKEEYHILDLGAGTGYWTYWLSERVESVYALEPSEKMLEICKDKTKNFKNIKYIKALAEDMPFDDESFDIINAQGDVLSYVEDLDKVLLEIKRVLKNDGILIASVDSFYSFMSQIISQGDFLALNYLYDKKKANIGSEDGIFTSRAFSAEDIEEICKKYDFEKIELAGKVICDDCDENIIEKNFEQLLNNELKICHDPYFIGEAEHIHFVIRKK
jgi:ubiquinone/menaquinone biosynthesis C-methylase UbiE